MDDATFRPYNGSKTIGIRVNEQESVFITGQGSLKLRQTTEFVEKVVPLTDHDLNALIDALTEIREFRKWDEGQRTFTKEDERIVDQIAERRITTQAPKAVVGAMLRTNK